MYLWIFLTGEVRLFTDDEIATLSNLMMSTKSLSPPRQDCSSPSDSVDSATVLSNIAAAQSGSSGGEDAGEAVGDATLVYRRLRQMLSTNSWAQDDDLRAALKTPFLRLCSHYLYTEKRRGYALNSVGRIIFYSRVCNLSKVI